CDGRYALEFTREFLQNFELETHHHEGVKKVAEKAFNKSHLSACAGVAIVKRHFPFSVAYHLAEELIKSAKAVKQKIICQETDTIPQNTPFPCSAIDFHILYDTSGIELDKIRELLKPKSTTQLYNRPYVVTAIDDLNEANQGQEWAKKHQWERLRDRAEALKNEEITNSQSHTIRTALFANQGDAQYKLIQQRFPDIKKTFEESEESLFYQNNEGISATSFLDALDAMDFLKTEKERQNDSNAPV
ncbi:MAG: hypothetical protein ACLFM2_00675, partial [Halothece sp.]